MNPRLEAMIDATGWTLVHSLWQGLLIALVVGLLLVILRQRNPVLRHGILVVGLLLFPAAAISTFVCYWDPQVHVTAAKIGAGLASPTLTLSFFERIVVPAFPNLVALWLLGSLLLVLRSLMGYMLAQYMVKRNAIPADEQWQARLQTLMELMDIRRGVRILLSNSIDVPMVMGHAKPVILLPISVLSGLPYAEVEAILLHELAHVKRNDYLLNLLQTGLEAIFFYHPGCWWMSARLRSERELCCDDLAIAVTRDPLTFAKALAHLEEVHMKIPFGAMAANGRGALFNRIERLMRPTMRTGPKEALTTTALILVGGLLFLHFTGLALAKPEQQAKAATKEAPSNIKYLNSFMDENGNGGITLVEEQIELRFRKGKLDSFKVQGQARPFEELEAYRPRFEQLIDQKEELEAIRAMRHALRLADAQARKARTRELAQATQARIEPLDLKAMARQDQETIQREEAQHKQVKQQQHLEAVQKHELAAKDAQMQAAMRIAAEHKEQQRALEAAADQTHKAQLQLESQVAMQEKRVAEANARAAAEADARRVVEEKENLKRVQTHLKDEVQKNKNELKRLEQELRTNEYYRDHFERNRQFHNPVSEVQTQQKAYYVQLDEVAKLKRMVAELSVKNHELTRQLREVKAIEESKPEKPEKAPSPDASESQQRPAAATTPVPKIAPEPPAPSHGETPQAEASSPLVAPVAPTAQHSPQPPQQ